MSKLGKGAGEVHQKTVEEDIDVWKLMSHN
jgi:hypothetical protein